jgi:hypothetical protein
MKKLLYINLDFKKYSNKAKAQIKAFSNLKINTEVATIENEAQRCMFKIYKYIDNDFSLILNKDIGVAYEVEQGNNSLSVLFKRVLKTKKINNCFKKEVVSYCSNNDFDYCYVRRIGFFVIFLTSMFKKISKKSKIIYEIPTYPLDKYDSFLVNFSQKIEMLYFNSFIKKYLSIIPINLQNDVKLDKKMMPIYNGIDYTKFDNVDVTKPALKKEFKMIIIAHILPWHGYDRLIESIREYSGNYDLKLDIYGEINTETLRLKKLVEKYKLKKSVSFKGNHSLEEILKNINDYHIAIGSLGYHRRNGKYDTSIKNKEYSAMGLPIVCSARDLSFAENFKYIYFVSSDDKSFDFDSIINWYKIISQDDYKKVLINYAKENFKYEDIYKKMFDRLGE